MRRLAFNTVVVSLVLVAAACSGDDGAEDTSTTATTSIAPVTSLGDTATTAPPDTTLGSSTSVTTTTEAGALVALPGYTIVAREPGDSGDTVVILLDTESYESLTDIDLENVLVDLVDRFPPILTAYVVDDAAAADIVVAESPTEAELELLGRHYLVRLEEGFRMVFAGPFAETPSSILGS